MKIYQLNINDVEMVGTMKELATSSGLSESHLRKIATGQIERNGTAIVEVGKTETKPCWRIDDALIGQWDDVVAPFKKVLWMPKDSEVGKKLEVGKQCSVL